MKLGNIVEILERELGTSDLNEINKIFKAKPELKFRLTGEALGHFGFTGQIKSLSEVGFKVYKSNKVVLIRLEDVETFGKPNSREERVARKNSPKPVAVAAMKPKKAKVVKVDDEWDDEDDDFDDEDSDFAEGEDEFFGEEPVAKKGKTAPMGKNGSKFIPIKK